MKKYLFYAMKGQKMCFVHTLLNAFDLTEAGHQVKIIFEGESVTLPAVLDAENNPLYKKALEIGMIVGVCKACSQVMDVLKTNQDLGLSLLDDMSGHAGMRPYVEQGYEVISI